MSPPAVLLAHLADARREGRELAEAWPAAVIAATAGLAASEREQWRTAFVSTREAWTAAYARERTAAAPLRALTLLTEDREPLEDGARLEACRRCAGPIPAGSRTSRRYCSDRCRRRASELRLAA